MRGFYRIFCLMGAFAPSVLWADLLPGGVVPFPDVPIMPVEHISKYSGGWLTPTAFPKTADDLSFTDRMVLKSKAYEPFRDLSAYHDLVVEGEEHFIERQMALAEIERVADYEDMPLDEYCDNYPLDDENCIQNPGAWNDVIDVADEYEYGTEYAGVTIGGGAVIANNKTRGGSCYPAAKNKYFKNQILTTGQYAGVSPAFEKALITVFRKEGKCGIIEGDPCGYTCFGIGQNCMGRQLGINVRNLTRADAENIYYEHFWKKYNIGILPDVISGDLFLAMMASGPQTGIAQFRKFLGLPYGYQLDESVANAVANYNGDIHNRWLDMRKQFLIQVAAKKYNNRVLNGWMRGIKLKRENGCHVIPKDPLFRQ